MCRIGFIVIVGAVMLSTNLQRAESFSHHRTERQHSSEEKNTTTASLENQSDEHVRPTVQLVKRDLESTKEKMKVKRNVQEYTLYMDHSSEETDNQWNQSDEYDYYDDSEELFKREIQQLTAEELETLFNLFKGYGSHSDEYFYSVKKQPPTTGRHSSEEDYSFENSIEDVLERLAFNVNKLPVTSIRK